MQVCDAWTIGKDFLGMGLVLGFVGGICIGFWTGYHEWRLRRNR